MAVQVSFRLGTTSPLRVGSFFHGLRIPIRLAMRNACHKRARCCFRHPRRSAASFIVSSSVRNGVIVNVSKLSSCSSCGFFPCLVSALNLRLGKRDPGLVSQRSKGACDMCRELNTR